MIFETLHESNQRGELLIVDGGMCHWHLRRDGQLTIREIIVQADRQSQGVGSTMLAELKSTPGACSLFAKCPVELAANGWYASRGFIMEGIETTKSGRQLKLWRYELSTARQETAGSLK